MTTEKLSSPPDQTQVFARKATGLVREASLFDVLAFNVNMQNVVIGVIFSLLLIPPLYPQANIYLATLIAFIAAVPVSWVYAKLSGVFPRSGGDYVFVSRIIHPAVAFTSNFSYCVWGTFYIGVSGVFLGIYGIAPLLRVIGAYTSNTDIANAGNWFARDNGKFIMAVGLIALFMLIFAFGGLRLYFRIQSVNFLIASVALLALIIWGIFVSPSHSFSNFSHQISNLGGNAAGIDKHVPSSAFSWRQTIYASIWPWLAFNSAIYSTYMGGEIKRADRNQVIGIMGALAWAFVFTMVATWAMIQAFGYSFWSNLGNADPAKLRPVDHAHVRRRSGYALGHAILAIVLMFGLALWSYVWIAPYTILVTRSMLAWSLDGLDPREARRGQRALSLAGQLAAHRFRPGSDHLGVLRLRNLSVLDRHGGDYRVDDPGGDRRASCSRFASARRGGPRPPRGGSRACRRSRIVSVDRGAAAALDRVGAAGGSRLGHEHRREPGILTYVVIIFLIGIPIYYAAKLIQRSRGIDVDLAYQEIPPE